MIAILALALAGTFAESWEDVERAGCVTIHYYTRQRAVESLERFPGLIPDGEDRKNNVLYFRVGTLTERDFEHVCKLRSVWRIEAGRK